MRRPLHDARSTAPRLRAATSLAAIVVAATTACADRASTPASDADAARAVVALSYAGRAGCTGTVIAPRVVLTAAHCVTPRAPDRVVVGEGRRLAVRAVRALPSYREDDLADDVAVVLLDEDVDVTPLAIVRDPRADPTSAIRARFFGAGTGLAPGGEARARGVGSTPLHAGRVRAARAAENSMWLLRPGPDQPCGGDSGGPVLDDGGRVIGVVSRGDAGCTSRAYATRVSLHAAAIARLVTGGE